MRSKNLSALPVRAACSHRISRSACSAPAGTARRCRPGGSRGSRHCSSYLESGLDAGGVLSEGGDYGQGSPA